MRGRIVELNRADTAEVEEVSRALWVSGAFGPGDLADELVSLVVQAGIKVAAKETVDERGLQIFVVSQKGSRLRSQQESVEMG